MSSADNVSNLLGAVEKYQGELDADGEIREGIRTTVRDIEKATKKIYFVIFNIHSDPSEKNLKETAEKVKDILETVVQPLLATLKEKIPTGDYYKYNDHYKHTLQRLAYMSILSNYLLNGTMGTIQETAASIGLKSVEEVEKTEKATLMLDYDDYLIGLLDMAAEFARFARNCVTFGGDIKRVHNIHESMNQLNAGMHNITFKNDYLRRRYDGLKYNIKSVEEVIYDLKIRGVNDQISSLNTESDVPSSDGGQPTESA